MGEAKRGPQQYRLVLNLEEDDRGGLVKSADLAAYRAAVDALREAAADPRLCGCCHDCFGPNGVYVEPTCERCDRCKTVNAALARLESNGGGD